MNLTIIPDFSDLTIEQQEMELEKFKCQPGKMQDVFNWIDINLDKWMFFTGQTATGKTHLATGIYKKRAGALIKESDKTVLYTTNYEMLMTCGKEYFDIATRNYYADFDLLVIDEVDKFPQTQKQSEIDTFFYIINKRHANRKQTIIISNCEWDDLIEKIGKENAEPLSRRFADRGRVIKCDWESYKREVKG